MLSQSVSIGIVTKNRWQDLKITLQKIVEVGLSSLPIFIYDDGSNIECPFDITSMPLYNLSLKHFNDSAGYIVRRNQLAHAMQTKYYLSLDDDSFLVSGSLQEALAFAETCDNLFCLSFPVYNPILKKYQNQSLERKPYQVRFYIGCGHLLHIERFLQLGGYRSELLHQGEEMEISARAFRKGWHCYHYPTLEIHHLASNANRNWHRMGFYGSRNIILWNDWFVPMKLKPFKQSRTLLSRVLHSFKKEGAGMIPGIIAGFRDIRRYKSNRANMSIDVYRRWKALPMQ